MVSLIFKEKYFPQGNFLGSIVGHNPSYIWRSIETFWIVLKEGHPWNIDDGSSIHVWLYDWLHGEGSSRVHTPFPTYSYYITVNQLIDLIIGN